MYKKIIREYLPPALVRFLSGLVYGWHGNYSSWDDAKKKCKGYDSQIILDRVKASALMVRDGKAAFERDSFLFDQLEYSYPLLSGILWIAARNNSNLNVLDFGGSLGSSYFQNKLFLDKLNSVNWCIVEQPDYVSAGLENFAGSSLHFFYSIDECIQAFDINVFILSSVLQYLEFPYDLLDKMKNLKCKYVIIDRTPFIAGKDRITVQRVNPKIYKGSYPCWFFNESEFLNFMCSSYKLITEFCALDKANIHSEFKGFIFEKISEV